MGSREHKMTYQSDMVTRSSLNGRSRKEVRMKLSETGAVKVRNGRKGAGRTANQGRGLRGITAKVAAAGDVRTDGLSNGGGQAAKGANSIPVTCWGPDGSCYEGMSSRAAGEVIFVESTRLIPVNTEVTIRFTPPDDVPVNRSVAKGTVVWHCTSSDHFTSRKGFGVCLQGRWPQPPGPTGNDDSKEAA